MRNYPKNVAKVLVYASPRGILYTCRDETGKVVYDSPFPFRSRRLARKEAHNRWPKAVITFDSTR